ncbi:hypothetical protein SAMN05720764_12118 [Fibrobacter sp. UWH5]|nr:hypothetical protein SAMN05720764_12118 [Fibrobacter sp. UWH5]
MQHFIAFQKTLFYQILFFKTVYEFSRFHAKDFRPTFYGKDYKLNNVAFMCSRQSFHKTSFLS